MAACKQTGSGDVGGGVGANGGDDGSEGGGSGEGEGGCEGDGNCGGKGGGEGEGGGGGGESIGGGRGGDGGHSVQAVLQSSSAYTSWHHVYGDRWCRDPRGSAPQWRKPQGRLRVCTNAFQ